jgi:glycolate oxidase FAD binding subunit
VASTLPKELAHACADVSEAGPGDAVAGVAPRFLARPASVAEAAAVLAAASSLGLTAVPRGSGTRLTWGSPPASCDLVIDTSRMNRVLEHAAGDLVVRVEAGVGLDQLAGVLARAGQRLALDPPGAVTNGAGPGGGGNGTIGGVLATGAAGPLRLRYGTPRDLAIGITVVRADGTVAKSGGKVVKNVAGYDLGKLFAGSYGTLGLIAEAAFRLHPQPAATAFVTLDAADADEASGVVAAAAGSPLAPSAVELDRPARGGPFRVGVLLEGDAEGVAERTARMTELLGSGLAQSRPPATSTSPAQSRPPATSTSPAQSRPPATSTSPAQSRPPATSTSSAASGPAAQPLPPSWWGRGAAAAGEGTLIRITFWAAELARVLAAVDAAASDAGLDPAVGGSAAAGVLYAAVGEEAEPAAVARFTAGLRDAVGRPAAAAPGEGPPAQGSAVVLRAPGAVRAAVDIWGPAPGLSLMRAIKDQFDPGHTMAPGRFAGGI